MSDLGGFLTVCGVLFMAAVVVGAIMLWREGMDG